jgi:hypothetical protein
VRRSKIAVVAASTTAVVLIGGASAYAIGHDGSSGGHRASAPLSSPTSSEAADSPTVTATSSSSAEPVASSTAPSPATQDPTPAESISRRVFSVSPAQPSATTTTVATPTVSGYAGQTTVVVTNNSGLAVDISLDHVQFVLPATPGAQKTVTFVSAVDGNDGYSIGTETNPPCGVADSGGYFRGGGSYTMSIVTGPLSCYVNGVATVTPSFLLDGPNGHSGGG